MKLGLTPFGCVPIIKRAAAMNTVGVFGVGARAGRTNSVILCGQAAAHRFGAR